MAVSVGIGHGLGGENDQKPIVTRIFGQDLNRLGETPRVGVAQDIHGIAVAPGGRQEGGKAFFCFRRKFGQLAPALDEGVGGQDSRPTRVGDQAKASAFGAGLFGKDVRHVEKMGDMIHA